MKEREEKQVILSFTHIKYSNMTFQCLVNIFWLISETTPHLQTLLPWAQRVTGSITVRQTEIILTTMEQPHSEMKPNPCWWKNMWQWQKENLQSSFTVTQRNARIYSSAATSLAFVLLYCPAAMKIYPLCSYSFVYKDVFPPPLPPPIHPEFSYLWYFLCWMSISSPFLLLLTTSA